MKKRIVSDAKALTRYQKISRLFGTAIIGFWPLGELTGIIADDISKTNSNGAYLPNSGGNWTGGTLGQVGIGNKKAAKFNGSSGNVSVFSAALAAAFNGQEGTIILNCWDAAGNVWTDGQFRTFCSFTADNPNRILVSRENTNGVARIRRIASGTTRQIDITGLSGTNKYMLGMTWSKTAEQLIAYLNGAVFGSPVADIRNFTGSITQGYIGTTTDDSGQRWSGEIQDVILLNRAATPTEMLKLYAL